MMTLALSSTSLSPNGMRLTTVELEKFLRPKKLTLGDLIFKGCLLPVCPDIKTKNILLYLPVPVPNITT